MQTINNTKDLKISKSSLSIYWITIFFSTLFSSATAQPNINLVRYDDNFLHLKSEMHKKGLDRLKYISLGRQNFISIGGELREQFQIYNNINFGDIPSNYISSNTSQLNHRWMMHADIELGKSFRFFTQFNNTIRLLNKNPLVSEIDENQLSLHQAFGEMKFSKWKFRMGRQEMFYGSHRIITVREGPNTRKTFDGITIKHKFKNGNLDLFAISPTVSKQYVFDDLGFKETLIGLYGYQYFINRKIVLDYYILNFQSRSRKYNYNAGFENRQTYGARLFSNLKTINFEVEGIYQSGTFGDLKIDAYNIFADVNLTFLTAKKGIIGIATNIASGDKNSNDNKLNTYNLLFAKPAYGLAIPIGSTNIYSIYPYMKINPTEKLSFLAQVFFLARKSDQDGTYSPAMIENRPKPGALFSTNKKTLGLFYVVETNYLYSKNLSFAFDASYFKSGSYPGATGNGKNIKYLSFKSTFKF